MHNHTKGIIYASITAFFWGFLAIALKVASREFEPVTIVWFRFFVAFTFLAVWQGFKNPSSFKILIKPPLLLILAALGLSWNYLGFMFGVHYTTPSNAQLFIQTGPITLAIVGITFFKEKLGRRQIIGFILAIAGLGLFYNQQLGQFIESENIYIKGVFLTISSALAWATYASLQKKLVTRFSVQTLNLFLFGFPALIYLPFINLSPLFELHWTWFLLMIFLGANTFIAYTCIANALKYTEANKVSMIIILNPLITFATMGILTYLDVSWITGERFTLLSVIGALIVLSGAMLVAGKKKK
ncbi:MAG: DMT family transporter [Prolixibacteraceae bacterium]|nr:DMT family transporter [Prolixibacteraceae bacterium]MBN2772944.1 DMT family transporter [Prolixibacteraceae bacterium]